MEYQRVGSNQIIYNMGDAAESVYFLRSGLVKLNAISALGKEIILSLHKPGEFFGESCFYVSQRGEMAVSMGPSEFVEIDRDQFFAILWERQEYLNEFLEHVFERLTRSYELIREFSFDRVPQRLARLLLRLADEFGQQTTHGTELTHFISQEELSQIILARREVVSMALARLRQQGMVGYSRKGRLTINKDALKAYLETESEPELSVRYPTQKKRAAGHG
jgi:CRP/FNR family transcriptional regulator